MTINQEREKMIRKLFCFECTHLTEHQMRVTDGVKRMDLYKTRYHKIDIDKRGSIRNNLEEILVNYFG